MARERYFSAALVFTTIAWAVVQIMYPIIPPVVGWPIVGVLGMAAVAFLIIGIRKKDSQNTLILTVRSWAIGITGMTGYPKEPGNAAWLLLEVSVNAIDRPIDTLDVIIDGKPVPANHWLSRKITAFNAYFNVNEWHYKGNNQIELIAKVGGEPYSSGRIPINFDVETWGKHLV